jgi:outer membrane protein OmpA-like peptidoglycan-associated protein
MARWNISLMRVLIVINICANCTVEQGNAQSVSQTSKGACSPNISNVQGNVVLNINCPGLDIADLQAALAQGGGVVLKQIKAEDLGAGSLLVSVVAKDHDDPTYRPLLEMSTAATTTNLFTDLDTVSPSPTAQALLANLATKLIALRRPVILSISGYWPDSCRSIDNTGHCGDWMSHMYANRVSLRAATAVKAVLVERGVPASCIFTTGQGFRDPITPQPADFRSLPVSEINRWVAINRRIQIEMTIADSECPA